MNNIIITVDSVTYAIKLKKMLSRQGIQSNLVKIEDKQGIIGCMHGVKISEKDFLSAVLIMKENGINRCLASRQESRTDLE